MDSLVMWSDKPSIQVSACCTPDALCTLDFVESLRSCFQCLLWSEKPFGTGVWAHGLSNSHKKVHAEHFYFLYWSFRCKSLLAWRIPSDYLPSMGPDRWGIVEARRAVLTEDLQRKRKPPGLQKNVQYWQLGRVEHTDPEHKQAMTE